MKQRIEVSIGGRDIALWTNEREGYVKQLAMLLDERVSALPGVRVETLLLLALELLDERVKEAAKVGRLEEEIETLQAQIVALEAGLSGEKEPVDEIDG